MSRRSFDDGHQNQAHTSGFDLNFQVMHNLFHPPGSDADDIGLYDDPDPVPSGHFSGTSTTPSRFIPYASEDKYDGMGPLPYSKDDPQSLEGGNTGPYPAGDPSNSTVSSSGYRRQVSFKTRSDASEADDLGDLVDPQNDTYEEEGTHGVPLAIGAAAKAYGKFRKTPAGKAVEAKAIEKGTEIAGKAMVAAKDKLKGKGGAGLASPASEGAGTPDRDDPFA